jgi:hypothetical protein
LNRYVKVYKKDGVDYLGYDSYDFTNPNTVVNLVANPKDFANVSGWGYSDGWSKGEVLYTELYPPPDENTDISTY